jgi:hypothetical protein
MKQVIHNLGYGARYSTRQYFPPVTSRTSSLYIIFYYDTKGGFQESKKRLIARTAMHKINRKTHQNSVLEDRRWPYVSCF